jgi:glucose-6-phosphate 1-dehydrogenase
MNGELVELIARHAQAGAHLPYERLLGDAMHGDKSLFTSDESVEAAWSVIDGILNSETELEMYEPGSWGPPAADEMTAPHGGWHNTMTLAESS